MSDLFLLRPKKVIGPKKLNFSIFFSSVVVNSLLSLSRFWPFLKAKQSGKKFSFRSENHFTVFLNIFLFLWTWAWSFLNNQYSISVKKEHFKGTFSFYSKSFKSLLKFLFKGFEVAFFWQPSPCQGWLSTCKLLVSVLIQLRIQSNSVITITVITNTRL